MKITIIYDSISYTYHQNIMNTITAFFSSSNINCSTIDISTFRYDHEAFAAIRSFAPDVLITLDLAGFRFRSQGDGCALNLLYSKNLNLIWGDKPEYEKWLSETLSLSMQFYDASGTDHNLSLKYPNLLYYSYGPDITADTWPQIWDNFLKACYL